MWDKHRGSSRYKTRLNAKFCCASFGVSCTVVDISAGGADIEISSMFQDQTTKSFDHISIPQLGTFKTQVRWSKPGSMGLKFKLNIGEQALLTRNIRKLAQEENLTPMKTQPKFNGAI